MILTAFHADIDECVAAVFANMLACPDESMLCVDNTGSFTCVCPGGTELIEGQCREPISKQIIIIETPS